jgi:hypothetical protein
MGLSPLPAFLQSVILPYKALGKYAASAVIQGRNFHSNFIFYSHTKRQGGLSRKGGSSTSWVLMRYLTKSDEIPNQYSLSLIYPVLVGYVSFVLKTRSITQIPIFANPNLSKHYRKHTI